ncbi:MAG: anthranilate synthase component I family protein, partial [Acidobacteriota bacterium]
MEPSTLSSFRKLCRRGNVVPIWREIPADCLTPVLAFLLTASRRRRSFLLESVEGGERFGRFSFVGRDPYRVLSARGLEFEESEGRRRTRQRGPFLERLRSIFQKAHPATLPGLPRFTGGAVGFISYDAIRLFEPTQLGVLRGRRPRAADPDLPDAWFGFYDTVLAFDHLHQTILLVASVRTEEDGRGLREQYDAGLARLECFAADLRRAAVPPIPRTRPGGVRRQRRLAVRSNMTRESYCRMVEAAQEHIRAGDIYQVVVSQRFRRRLACDPFTVYRVLRRINPSPYMYFLRDGQTSLAGASPEMLVRVVDRHVELHPIAGTRRRGGGPAEDEAMEAELGADPKERAEHVMLVDLGRNDLGRVCEYGTVSVDELMAVETYSHVLHIVS